MSRAENGMSSGRTVVGSCGAAACTLVFVAALACWLGAARGARAQSPPPAPAASADPSVMIVFDGSGSMWGRIEGDNKTNKLTVGREALRPALSRPGTAPRVGLVSFGHRRKADCSDIELIVPPEPGPGDRVPGALEKLNPRGKGPIVGGLREAAKALQGRAPASIILIHDNADNCGQDVCAAAEAMAKAQPGLAIHAIGAALDEDDAKRMACVARGGGKFTNAPDAAAMTAAIGEAMRVALLDQPQQRTAAPGTGPAVGPKEAPAVKPPVPPAGAEGVAGLSLAARFGAEGPAVEVPVSWRIAKAGETVPLVEATVPAVFSPLGPGKYDVEARLGPLVVRQTLEVPEAGRTTAVLSLPGGRLRYVLRNGKAAEGVAGAVVSLFAAGADGKGIAVEPVAISREPSGQWHLTPGAYVLRIEQGTLRRDVPLALASGAVLSEEVQLGTGRLQVSLQARDDAAPLTGAGFVVSEDDPESPQGLREVVRSAAPQPEFVLRAGTYQVGARYGDLEMRQRVAVGAGDTVKVPLVLGLGRVQVALTLDNGLAKSAVPVLTRALRIEAGGEREVARSTARNPVLEVPAGRYRFEAHAGEQNARVSGEMEVKPEGSGTLALRLDAGQVQLRGAGASALTLQGETLWEIKDAKGRVIWRTTQAEPKAVLAPGRYVVRAERRDKSSERMLDLAAGDVRSLDFAP